jgi:transcriptional regulator with XRE-family HTH domain
MSRRFSPTNVRVAREALGLSRERLARRLDISSASVFKYETGVIAPSARILGRLADELDVTVDSLFESDLAASA